MPPTVIHLLRHGQGEHQLEPLMERIKIHDPSLTGLGLSRCEEFSLTFPRQDQIELVCASPLRRTIQTAQYCFGHALRDIKPIVLLPLAQEDTDDPCDTGSSRGDLLKEFGNLIDLQFTPEDWNSKTGIYAPTAAVLRQRVLELRLWIRNRPENELVVVGHGGFFHWVTGEVDAHGNQTGIFEVNHNPAATWLTIPLAMFG